MDGLKNILRNMPLLYMIVSNPLVLALFFLMGIVMLFIFTTVFIGGGTYKGHEESMVETPAFASCSLGELNEGAFYSNFNSGKAGVFEGMGDVFVEAAETNQIDPVLLASIAWHETGAGKSRAVKLHNNPGGLMNPKTGSLFRYSSLSEGIDKMASNLYRLYIAQGLVTIPDIGGKYAPIGVSNDPTNLNSHWVPVVTKLVSQFGGLTMNCTDDFLESSGEWGMPIVGSRVTSPFGNRIHPIHGGISFHKGVDFSCSRDQAIFATQDGTVEVVSIGWTGGYGNYILLKHGVMYSAYAHLNSVDVSQGSTVKQGERIGGCGTTGSSTGNHLHFEIKSGASTGHKDPLKYVGG